METYRFPDGHRERVVISPESDGVYVLVFRRGNTSELEYDYRVETVAGAKRYCEASWNVPLNGWQASTEDVGDVVAFVRQRRRGESDGVFEFARDAGGEAAGCLRPLSILSLLVHLF